MSSPVGSVTNSSSINLGLVDGDMKEMSIGKIKSLASQYKGDVGDMAKQIVKKTGADKGTVIKVLKDMAGQTGDKKRVDQGDPEKYLLGELKGMEALAASSTRPASPNTMTPSLDQKYSISLSELFETISGKKPSSGFGGVLAEDLKGQLNDLKV